MQWQPDSPYAPGESPTRAEVIFAVGFVLLMILMNSKIKRK